ncbi:MULTISPECIES: preprotein translocase subunit SecA [Deefgea]|uniref:Protein translocase subunit SecA n=1 Tax=Deefgea chitinilytica TaxID=570276 RepID=A0ABS2CFP6_9NEIS|nr:MULTISPECIES: preprotein translocase subunit SecA [Deefgea]MBM5572211.1 preprotein translocase subunit SecA [Deefgea chitinilytica]MBM9889446.1 preprotein translocase subunit SecA [Deefgea sp. CFH1-16]
MISTLLKKVFGSRNDRLLKQYGAIVKQINALEPTMAALTDEALRAKTEEFKARLAKGETLDQILPEAFAVCREGAKRSLGLRHFDVQLIGGLVQHQGKISEMRTGEGKTLVATLAAYLNALSGKGVHVITVNDYLAKRDRDTMAVLFEFLGLTCGVNLGQMAHEDKKAAYECDITYGTNNEFGFDYLRDNMVFSVGERVQRGLNFAIVDEVDSILIDEARTPLIISGPADDNTDLYMAMNGIPGQLTAQTEEEGEGDYWVDEKAHTVMLSEAGHEKVEAILTEMGLLPEGDNLYNAAHISLIHHLNAALRAHSLFNKDQHYVVMDGEIIIVDEHTGRLMSGRRWSEGLHQAVEAKEGVEIQQENQTLATITLQNYFRMYSKLAGMTGTADTEAYEFQQIYGLETVIIPTNKPMQREDRQDQVFKTANEKYKAIITDIKGCVERGQPTLVGTTSIEQSELLSGILTADGIAHNVLNAKHHAKEAQIVAQAGALGQVTIATNMAGRGTDIVLGGSIERELKEIEHDDSLDAAAKAAQIAQLKAEWQVKHDAVLAAGGLHIIGTERHDSRRIDNQLRGRSGRQGDPGSSRFYLSLEDTLLRIFAGDRVAYVMDKLKMPEGEPIEAGMVSRAIESAQRKVEGRNFDMRKQLLEYDDVANEQRKAIYGQRNEILESEEVSATINAMRDSAIGDLFDQYIPPNSMEELWNAEGLEAELAEMHIGVNVVEWVKNETSLTIDEMKARVLAAAKAAYDSKVEQAGETNFRNFERSVLLQHVDQHWRDHLSALDHLRQGIHLRGYAQKNPKQEYKREAFELFSSLLDNIKRNVLKIIMTVQIRGPEDLPEVQQHEVPESAMQFSHTDLEEILASGDEDRIREALMAAMQENSGIKVQFSGVGRNDPCPCGSGKKYKHCHGQLA